MKILQKLHNFILQIETNKQKKYLRKASVDLSGLHQATAILLRLYSEGYRCEPEEDDYKEIYRKLYELKNEKVGSLLRQMKKTVLQGTQYEYNLVKLIEAIAITYQNALAYGQRDRHTAYMDKTYQALIKEYIKPIHQLTSVLVGEKK